MPPRKGKKAAAKAVAAPEPEPELEQEPEAEQEAIEVEVEPLATKAEGDTVDAEPEVTEEASGAAEGGSKDAALTPAERLEKMKALRKRMAETAQANRKDLIAETNLQRTSAKNAAKLERKRKQLEAMGEKAEAAETGEDLERKRAWEYSIEDNEKWDKKVARKGRRGDFAFTDFDDIARRKYKKDMDVFKPDHKAYNAQREAAEGASSALLASTSSSAAAQAAAEDLYRDANSFVYADHKPSEDAIDRVIGKINLDIDKRSKKSRIRKDEDEGDITYINERNRMFNKKLDRFYSAQTKEIRDNFERGTAL